MKNIILVVLFLSAFMTGVAAPNGGWKCGNEYDFTVTIAYTDPGGIEYCTKTWKNDCKHWLWGSRTILSTVTTVCNPYQGTLQLGILQA